MPFWYESTFRSPQWRAIVAVMRALLAVFLLIVPAAAQDLPSRPVCNRQTRGALYPQEPQAAASPVRERLSRCQALEMCVPSLFGYRWAPIRVPYWQIAGQPRPASCETTVASTR